MSAMASLLHEIWEDLDEYGNSLPACALAGPQGDGLRQMLGPRARLIHTFEANSHFEAMTIYNAFLGRGSYESSHSWDHEPYPEVWTLPTRP